jgi:curved DNA-binding protein CbpA
MADLLENQYDNDKFIDFYKILDVDSEATVPEIKSKYLLLAKKYHPDQQTGNTEMFQLVSKAYEILSNKETRTEYDVYYIKKGFSELDLENTYYSLKDQFNEFIVSNDKPKISQEEISKIYDEVFKDREQFIETKIDNVEIMRRKNDIDLEREVMNIETENDRLKTIIENNPELELEVGKVLEFIKEQNTHSTDLVKTELGTLDTLPSLFNNSFSSFADNQEILPNSFYTSIDDNFTNSKEQIKNFDINTFNEWKKVKSVDARLENNEIDNFLNKRRLEELELLQEVETNLKTNVKNRTHVEMYLKPKNKPVVHINENDLVPAETIDNVKKRTL